MFSGYKLKEFLLNLIIKSFKNKNIYYYINLLIRYNFVTFKTLLDLLLILSSSTILKPLL